MVIDYNNIPIIESVLELVQSGFIPGGTKNNLDHVSPKIHFSKNISKDMQYILADAQTSGGLLISISEDKVHSLQKILTEYNCLSYQVIGKVQKYNDYSIYVN